MSSHAGGTRSYARRARDQPYLDPGEEAAAVAAVRRYVEARAAGGCSARWLRHLRARARTAESLLVRSHLRLVVGVAGRYRANPRVDVDDLVQEGNLALLDAVEGHALRGRGRFAAYAYGPVRAAVARAADVAGHPATVPARLLREARQVDRARRELERCGPVAREQVRLAVGVTERRLRELEQVAVPPLLLSTPLGEGTLTVGDTLYYRSEQDAVSLAGEGPSVAAALDRHLGGGVLTRQEELVVRERFGVHTGIFRQWLNPDDLPTRPFADIAARLYLSETQVRVLYRRALAKLRRLPDLAALAADPTRHLQATDPEDVASGYLTAAGT